MVFKKMYDLLLKKISSLEENVPLLVPYFATLYFVEILYFMFILLLVYGKAVSAFSGVIFSLFLTWHIIGLYLHKNIFRKVHLFVMDIHIAFSAGYLINRLAGDMPLSFADEIMIAVRIIMMVCEAVFIILLTRGSVIRRYC